MVCLKEAKKINILAVNTLGKIQRSKPEQVVTVSSTA